jgi:hypothetical protein
MKSAFCQPSLAASRSFAQGREVRQPLIVWRLQRTNDDATRLLFNNYRPWKRLTSLCHLDRSAAKWRDLRFQRTFPGNGFPTERPSLGQANLPLQFGETRVTMEAIQT